MKPLLELKRKMRRVNIGERKKNEGYQLKKNEIIKSLRIMFEKLVCLGN